MLLVNTGTQNISSQKCFQIALPVVEDNKLTPFLRRLELNSTHHGRHALI